MGLGLGNLTFSTYTENEERLPIIGEMLDRTTELFRKQREHM
jgi:hypothetical protein